MTDEELWKQWKRNPTPQTEAALLRGLEPLIFKQVQRWQGVLAPQLLELEAKRLALAAAKSYSPAYGTKLSTHITNQLQQLSRLTYTHQNIARIPENRVMRISAYQNAFNKLQDQLGRTPTVEELAEELCWPRSHVELTQRMLHREVVESGVPIPTFDRVNTDVNTIAYVYSDLSPLHKKIFEYTTGWGGAPILKREEMAKKLHLTPAQLSYQKRLMIKELEAKL